MTSKRDLGNTCPCCGPWKKDSKGFRKKARRVAKREIREIWNSL